MKKIYLLIPIMLFITGCGLTTQQNQKIADIAKQITDITSEVQTAIIPLTAELQEQGVISDDTLAKIEKVSGEIDRVKGQIETVSESIKQSSGGVETLQAANTATAPFNPYSGIIGAGLTLWGIIASLIAKKKAGQIITLKDNLEVASTAITEVVRGIQEYKKIGSDEEVKKLKSEIYKATVTPTSDVKIAEIKASL